MSEPKILLWDIEASDLSADVGHIFCIGYKWAEEIDAPVQLVSQDTEPLLWRRDPIDDSHVVSEFLDVWNQADYSVTWYGRKNRGYDEPYLKTRALVWGFPALKPIPSLDLWSTVSREFKLSNNRMQTYDEFMGRSHKTRFDRKTWRRALLGPAYDGGQQAMDLIKDHCVKDILALEEAYLDLKPYLNIREGGERSDLNRCTHCGGTHLQRRGHAVSHLQARRQRVQCQTAGCYRWDTRPATWKP